MNLWHSLANSKYFPEKYAPSSVRTKMHRTSTMLDDKIIASRVLHSNSMNSISCRWNNIASFVTFLHFVFMAYDDKWTVALAVASSVRPTCASEKCTFANANKFHLRTNLRHIKWNESYKSCTCVQWKISARMNSIKKIVSGPIMVVEACRSHLVYKFTVRSTQQTRISRKHVNCAPNEIEKLFFYGKLKTWELLVAAYGRVPNQMN